VLKGKLTLLACRFSVSLFVPCPPVVNISDCKIKIQFDYVRCEGVDRLGAIKVQKKSGYDDNCPCIAYMYGMVGESG
jgi:hypothetical protein